MWIAKRLSHSEAITPHILKSSPSLWLKPIPEMSRCTNWSLSLKYSQRFSTISVEAYPAVTWFNLFSAIFKCFICFFLGKSTSLIILLNALGKPMKACDISRC